QRLQPLWEHRTASKIDCGPLIVGDRLFIGEENGKLKCLSLSKGGNALWSVDTEERLYGPIIASSGQDEFLLASSLEGSLFAVSPTDGKEKWRQNLGDRIVGLPLFTESAVAVASGTGSIKLLDKQTGKILYERRQTSGLQCLVPAGKGNSRLAVSDIDGNLLFLSAENLKPIRSLKFQAPLSSLASALAVPLSLAGEEDSAGELEHLVIAADRAGVIYLMDAEGF
ncbi:MAG: PQQ-binding-like beta-propeller repeat protein, partial [Planctomycetota bacterium]|nr:PQQ-binding-like beta-propeller repeat protein [Planctomycetota bacterium]